MIKKHKITEYYHVLLYCDKCGKRMNKTDINYTEGKVFYKYVCECGHEVTSRDDFPCLRISFEIEGVEMTQEEWEDVQK